jgi:hypothetical protein
MEIRPFEEMLTISGANWFSRRSGTCRLHAIYMNQPCIYIGKVKETVNGCTRRKKGEPDKRGCKINGRATSAGAITGALAHCTACTTLRRKRTLNIDDILVALNLPVLVTQGSADRLILPAAARYTAQKIPGAKLSMYDSIGHAPFWEDAARFNAELAAVVRAAGKTN